jgi:cyclopropane-fatty-acyl-phospholipid synthase
MSLLPYATQPETTDEEQHDMSATQPSGSPSNLIPGRPVFTVVPSGRGASARPVERQSVSESAADRAARGIALALLERYVEGGRITIDDGPRHHVFGGMSPDRRACPPLEANIVVRHPGVWRKALAGGSVGLGEAYFDGWWDSDDLPQTLRLLGRTVRRSDHLRNLLARTTHPASDRVRRLRRSDKLRDRRNIQAHYDLGNDFFELFLDETMMYSSAVFPRWDASLAEASTHKLDLLCRRLDLTASDHVVEIGTGWGGFAVHAASRYGCRVTTTTISDQQYDYARDRVRRAGLADRVTVLKEDYRDLTGRYDKLASIEMIEAVDWREYETFFATCRRLLAPHGVLGMQAIVIEPQRFDRAKTTQDFIKAFIFPGGCLPSIDALTGAATRSSDLALTGLDDYGVHYAETLRRWRAALSGQRDRLRALGLGEAFARMWEFYLAYCEAAFDERSVSVVQMTLAGPGWRPRR